MSPTPRKRPAATRKSATKKPPTGEATAAATTPPPPASETSQPPPDTPPEASPPSFVPTPPTAATVATLVPIEAARPNLLDTGLSDYGMWIDIVERMTPPPLDAGSRPGRIWA
jgi:hypothetical protein